MKRKRSYLEIAKDILRAARFGARPTELVYKSNLNFNIIKKYLQEMETSGLIVVEELHGPGNQTRLYHVTEKGNSFIEALGSTLEIYYSSVSTDRFPPDLIQEVNQI